MESYGSYEAFQFFSVELVFNLSESHVGISSKIHMIPMRRLYIQAYYNFKNRPLCKLAPCQGPSSRTTASSRVKSVRL